MRQVVLAVSIIVCPMILIPTIPSSSLLKTVSTLSDRAGCVRLPSTLHPLPQTSGNTDDTQLRYACHSSLLPSHSHRPYRICPCSSTHHRSRHRSSHYSDPQGRSSTRCSHPGRHIFWIFLYATHAHPRRPACLRNSRCHPRRHIPRAVWLAPMWPA